jgi:hypothetical protein
MINIIHMIDIAILLIWLVWHLNTYGLPPFLFNLIIKLYDFYTTNTDFFNLYDKIIYSDFWLDNDEYNKENISRNEIITEPPKQALKYEDKYLEDIRRLNKEWEFTEDENNELSQLIEDFLNGYIKSKTNRLEEITNEINNIEKDISEDTDSFNYVEDFDDEGDEFIHENTIEERNNEGKAKINELQEEYNKIKTEIGSEKGMDELKCESMNKAREYIINKRFDKLKNCYVMEKTPIGNVLMIYEKERETFKYYSDCNIPYRYLEVVGRKYVKVFGCRPIFIDMEEEIRLFEEKWEKEQELKKIKEEEDKKFTEEEVKNQQQFLEGKKKNVFAKFKSYNKDAGGKISMAAPPKNSIPNNYVNEKKENDKILLKERANRYTYEGKFANFNFLQKIERKVFNKKLGLSFGDFKKMKK